MQFFRRWMPTALALCLALSAQAHINPDRRPAPRQPDDRVDFRASCNNAVAQIDQQVNNVRARLTTGGDVWWDGNDGRYVVPKPPPGVPEVSSIFAGAVWLGGVDPGGNLKVAAQTFGRSSGDFDFYPGPLEDGTGTVEQDTCARWDRFFVVTGESIQQHLAAWAQARSEGRTSLDPESIPEDILGWPGFGNRFFLDIHGFQLPNTSQGLAGFWDDDVDGVYEPDEGDYPIIEIRGCSNNPQYPDEMIFWIYNDAGNVHRESGTQNQIQMEVQVQAFAYRTADDINNMTFQRYKLINRAQEDIDSTFFAMWVDPDLGCYTDDFVGCDVGRSLGYVYNADEFDGEGTNSCTCPQGVNTYCDAIPILGVDYFRGPRDELGNELGMSSFTYYNNSGSTPTPAPGTTDPGTAQEYYNYLTGSWRDGRPFEFGGNAYDQNTFPIDYAFVDAPNNTEGWSMCSEGLPVGDRRTIQASGPFRLKPGAVNELIIGVVWVPEQPYPCPSIRRLQQADDIAQDLFDNCFELPRGPDAPDVDWIELDQEIIAVLTNDTLLSNNAFENYAEEGLGLPDDVDGIYRFEGYKIYQLSGANVSLADVEDANKVRLVAQVDVRNNVQKIFNWEGLSADDGETPTEDTYFVPVLQVDGADQGIKHTFRFTEDAFSGQPLVNHKKYYYVAIAYGYNNYKPFDANDPTDRGQQTPYIQSSRNIGDGENSFYTVIPRPIVDRNLNAMYGDGALITRLAGVGTGGNFLDITEETRDRIEASFEGGRFSGEVTYEEGFGPFTVSVFNPLDVVDGEYELTFVDENMSNNRLDNDVRWVLRRLNDPASPVITSDEPISQINEQIIRQYGFSILVSQVQEPGADPFGTNGAVGYDEEYFREEPLRWITGVPDNTSLNIPPLEVSQAVFDYVSTELGERDNNVDPEQRLSTIGPGYFVPYYLADWADKENNIPYITPAWISRTNSNAIARSAMRLANLNNVDIVLTSDKSKWSRCPVVETNSKYFTNSGFNPEGNRNNFDLRSDPSVTKEAGPDGLPQVDPAGGEGMAWFPGYAIDVETGKRLNIFFGENSAYNGTYAPQLNNGGDMMWNPSSFIYFGLPDVPPTIYNYVAGGQHFIYVTNTEYDGGEALRQSLRPTTSITTKLPAIRSITWAGFLMLQPGFQLKSYAEGLIPEDVALKLRVNNAYQWAEGAEGTNGYPTYRFRIEGKQAAEQDQADVENALDLINIVPNPYYGFADYEDSQFETIVRITNLPPRCVVTIYTIDGKFIRQYNRDETGAVPRGSNRGIDQAQVTPHLEWDLKNFKNIPVASGVYLVHVASPGLGERTLKWFGVNRQFDPSGL